MAMTPWNGGVRGGGWAGQGYGPIPSVVLMQDPTAAPYAGEKKPCLPNIWLTSRPRSVSCVRTGGLVACPLASPSSLCPTERCAGTLPAPAHLEPRLLWLGPQGKGLADDPGASFPVLPAGTLRSGGLGPSPLGSSQDGWDDRLRALGVSHGERPTSSEEKRPLGPPGKTLCLHTRWKIGQAPGVGGEGRRHGAWSPQRSC